MDVRDRCPVPFKGLASEPRSRDRDPRKMNEPDFRPAHSCSTVRYQFPSRPFILAYFSWSPFLAYSFISCWMV